eukprot:6205626-Pleurochrysis_carterae.AAC.1
MHTKADEVRYQRAPESLMRVSELLRVKHSPSALQPSAPILKPACACSNAHDHVCIYAYTHSAIVTVQAQLSAQGLRYTGDMLVIEVSRPPSDKGPSCWSLVGVGRNTTGFLQPIAERNLTHARDRACNFVSRFAHATRMRRVRNASGVEALAGVCAYHGA